MYIFKDIKDFLKKHYNLEWRDYKVNDNREIRKVKVSDIKLKSRFFSKFAIVHENGKKKLVSVSVNGDKYFNVACLDEETNTLMYEDLNETSSQAWERFLEKRYNTELAK